MLSCPSAVPWLLSRVSGSGRASQLFLVLGTMLISATSPWSMLCSVFLVFEYCEHDLGQLLDSMPKPFHPAEVKSIIHQVQSVASQMFVQS